MQDSFVSYQITCASIGGYGLYTAVANALRWFFGRESVRRKPTLPALSTSSSPLFNSLSEICEYTQWS